MRPSTSNSTIRPPEPSGICQRITPRRALPPLQLLPFPPAAAPRVVLTHPTPLPSSRCLALASAVDARLRCIDPSNARQRLSSRAGGFLMADLRFRIESGVTLVTLNCRIEFRSPPDILSRTCRIAKRNYADACSPWPIHDVHTIPSPRAHVATGGIPELAGGMWRRWAARGVPGVRRCLWFFALAAQANALT